MTTALVLINDAFNDLEIKSAEVDLTDDEINTGIRYLNRQMTSWASEGLNLGFTKVVTRDDETDIPDYAEEAVISNLSIRLAPSFGVSPSAVLIALAVDSKRTLEHRLVVIPETSFPNSLPIGGGNRQNAGNNTKFFADNTQSDLLNGSGVNLSDDESVYLSE